MYHIAAYRLLGSAVALATLSIAGSAQSTPVVPAQYQEAYNAVNSRLAGFETTIKSKWSGAPSNVLYSAQLQTATSDLTSNLLSPYYYPQTVMSELNSLQSLGVKAITFHINFPALYQPYYANQADYQAYVNFYTTLVSEIRGRGLKVIIENTAAAAFPGSNASDFTAYYKSLDWSHYVSQRSQNAANIAKLLRPDYLAVLTEPDTEANSVGQPSVDTVSGGTQLVSSMISAIQSSGAGNVQITAGCGTWDSSFTAFLQSLVTLPLQLIDMHIYPVNRNNLPNALIGLGIIRGAGKRATLSEVWAYKENDTEYLAALPYTSIFARDAFNFWASTDTAFLQAMSDFANYGNFVFVSPFWTHQFAAYLDYNVYGGSPDDVVVNAAAAAATQANMVGSFTSTGRAYENMAIPSPDQTAPTVPAAPALVSYSQTAANLSWAPTVDNVGVAAYQIYRNNQLIATVSSPLTFLDMSLSANTTYSYSLTAFDAAGNITSKSSPLTFTTYSDPDHTAPSIPRSVAAIPVSDTKINLTWLPSSDNVGVIGYVVYRGTTASNIAAYATTSGNSFSDTTAAPSQTYYYQVDAYDAYNNHSTRSTALRTAALPDSTPPSVPQNVSVRAAAGSGVTVSWSASTDDYWVAAYIVYRGKDPSNMQIVGSVLAPSTSFVDANAVSSTTYYYAVSARDLAANNSALSGPVPTTAP